MFPAPHYREYLSLVLSEVLDDIGVNEKMVKETRRMYCLRENMDNITYRSHNRYLVNNYNVGSLVEGTTTLGLNPDNDVLIFIHDTIVIQDRSEWELGKINYLMIQDENTTPGYCFLQLFQSNKPIPATDIPGEHHITDRKGRILYKNTLIKDQLGDADHLDGPSIATKGQYGYLDIDKVFAYPCKSWPQLASSWLERKEKGRWPTQEMRRCAANTCCCVVSTGSKVSVYPELEWRISTSLAERCIMFNLNITQIRCYVLMKMILKSFLNPQKEKNLTSYMCKTVLLHCIENTELSIWKESNLLTCLIYNLQELHTCVQNDRCLHFIISKNNLMAGQFTAEAQQELLKDISDFIQSHIQSLLRINIDDLGCRLQVKLNIVPQRANNFLPSLKMHELLSVSNCVNLATQINKLHDTFLNHLQNKDIRTLQQFVERLMTLSAYDDDIIQDSCKLIAPFLFTTYGSAVASSNIGENNHLSNKAMALLSIGSNSDVSSSRLKMASVFYSVGHMEKAEQILRNVEQQYHSNPLYTLCHCCPRPLPAVSTEFERACYEQGENCTIKQMMSFCVKFIQKEINCVPHELQYEMFRSTQDDMIHRDPDYDLWMDWAVIDSLPFLYFLQYKIYGRLQRQQEQQQALNNLIETTVTDKILGHRETVLNILGQCMEQENRPQLALESYLLSLQQRRRNNVAIIHICRLLSGILVNQQNGSGQDTQVD